MTPESFDLLSSSNLIPSNYAQQAREVRKAREEKIKHLFRQRKLPDEGWSDSEIELLVHDLAQMDSNSFPANCGVGEREARIYSGLVSRRHFGLGHGVGRSGDLTEVQPKAAGSSTLNKLTSALVVDLLHRLGVRSCQTAFVAPVATGMAMALCLLTIKKVRPNEAKYVIWSRIDQKSCYKSILCVGFVPVVLELNMNGEELQTDLEALGNKISELGANNIVAVMTTTASFAPRACDNLPEVSKICKENDIPHLINNAYGIQSTKCLHLIEEAGKVGGPCDTFVQSTDKNFMVPVGGAIIAGFNQEWIQKISQNYPGRASASPVIDLFITLMSMGFKGYKNLMNDRKENYKILKEEMSKLAAKYGETVMETKNNPISIAMTLNNICDKNGDGKSVSEVGSMLFTRGVSGTRVLTGKGSKTIGDHTFKNWGSHSDNLNTPYLTAAAAIGMTKGDIDLFVKRLDKVLTAKSSVSTKKQ